jgi:hypothetical protein
MPSGVGRWSNLDERLRDPNSTNSKTALHNSRLHLHFFLAQEVVAGYSIFSGPQGQRAAGSSRDVDRNNDHMHKTTLTYSTS